MPDGDDATATLQLRTTSGDEIEYRVTNLQFDSESIQNSFISDSDDESNSTYTASTYTYSNTTRDYPWRSRGRRDYTNMPRTTEYDMRVEDLEAAPCIFQQELEEATYDDVGMGDSSETAVEYAADDIVGGPPQHRRGAIKWVRGHVKREVDDEKIDALSNKRLDEAILHAAMAAEGEL